MGLAVEKFSNFDYHIRTSATLHVLARNGDTVGCSARQNTETPTLIRVPYILMCALICLVMSWPAGAEDSETIKFMGHEIVSAPGTYVVRKDVNIRSAPRTSGKRLGKFEDGVIINIAGRVPKSEWYAALDGGDPRGFVFGSVLSPIIDGRVDDDVTGELQVGPNLRCGFRVIFTAKTGGQGGLIRTSDYEVTIVCERGGERIRFPAQMFITEEPFNGSRKQRVFQVNVDLLDGLHGLDDVFSTISLFDLDKSEVRFDRVTEPIFATGDNPAEVRPAANVREALAAALEIALIVWSPTIWNEIFERAG